MRFRLSSVVDVSASMVVVVVVVVVVVMVAVVDDDEDDEASDSVTLLVFGLIKLLISLATCAFWALSIWLNRATCDGSSKGLLAWLLAKSWI